MFGHGKTRVEASAIVSLDEVARDPQKLDGLDALTLAALALRATMAAGSIAARLALAAANQGTTTQPPPADDHMLKPAEAAAMLRVKPRWIYRNAQRLPFVRRLGSRCLLCSETALREYLARHPTP